MASPRLIVPTTDAVMERAAAEVAVAPAANLTHHGGPVLSSVRVFTIYWGAAWADDPNVSQLPGQIDAFFDFVLTSSLLDLLAEYGVAGQPIGRGARIGTTTITDSEPGGAARTIADADIAAALAGWISAQTVPAADANTLYFVYLPPGVTSTLGNASSCRNYCGYHNASGGLYYAVEPFVDCPGCNFTNDTVLTNLTVVSSHELCEAITDPALDGWFDDSSGEEIGDICASHVVDLGGWSVQSEWSNAQAACVIAPP